MGPSSRRSPLSKKLGEATLSEKKAHAREKCVTFLAVVVDVELGCGVRLHSESIDGILELNFDTDLRKSVEKEETSLESSNDARRARPRLSCGTLSKIETPLSETT